MKSPKTRVLALALFCACQSVVSDAARGDSVVIRPVADTTLQEAFPNNNEGDGVSFLAGGRRQGGRTRALMLFNIAGSVPLGSTIDSVSLNLSVVGAPSGGANSVFDLNRLLASWGEGNGSDRSGGTPGVAGAATWLNRMGAGTPWTTPGGTFVATASASRLITGFGVFNFSSSANLVSDVQGWLNNPASNFGWLLRSESELAATSIRRFGSRNDLPNSPALTIVYTVPEPGSVAICILGLAVAFFRLHSARRGK